MNGFPLILLGIVLFAVAYALLKVQSKMKEVTDAIDLGFKTIEDGITQNLLGPNGALTQASDAIDKNYGTIKNGIEKNVLGPQGLLSKNRDVMNFANGVCIAVGDEIIAGKNILKNDIRKTTGDIEKILQNTGAPLVDAGTWFIQIGNGIDIEIIDAHPFAPIAQPFRDIGKTVGDIGGLALLAESDLVRADNRIIKAEESLQKISDNVKAIGPQIIQVRDYVDVTFTKGVNDSMGELEHLGESVKGIFTAVEKGAQTSVNNLKSANAHLDAQLTGMIKRQYIYGLTTAAVALIAAGVALGI